MHNSWQLRLYLAAPISLSSLLKSITPISKKLISIASGVLCIANFAYAQNYSNVTPQGGKVVAGSAVITQSGLQTNVNQSSQRAVVNWDSFNVGKGASVNFNQPNARIARPTETGTVSTAGAGTVVTAVMADGSPMPGWLKFNPDTKTFSADKAPEGLQSLQVKVQTMQGDNVVGEVTLTLNTK